METGSYLWTELDILVGGKERDSVDRRVVVFRKGVEVVVG